MKHLTDKTALKGLRQRLADIDELNAKMTSTQERMATAEATVARLADQRDGILAERQEHDDAEPDRVNKLLNGETPEPTDDDTAVQREAHNRQVTRRAKRVDRDIELISGERDKCEARVAELESAIAESWGDFWGAVSDALIDEWHRAAPALMQRLMVPVVAVSGKLRTGGPRNRSFDARAGFKLRIRPDRETSRTLDLWEGGGPVASRAYPRVDHEALCKELLAEILGAQR